MDGRLDFTGLKLRDWAILMQRAGWPPERIEAAFDTLEEDEDIVVIAADYITIRKGDYQHVDRRFHMVEPKPVEICPTCGREK